MTSWKQCHGNLDVCGQSNSPMQIPAKLIFSKLIVITHEGKSIKSNYNVY